MCYRGGHWFQIWRISHQNWMHGINLCGWNWCWFYVMLVLNMNIYSFIASWVYTSPTTCIVLKTIVTSVTALFRWMCCVMQHSRFIYLWLYSHWINYICGNNVWIIVFLSPLIFVLAVHSLSMTLDDWILWQADFQNQSPVHQNPVVSVHSPHGVSTKRILWHPMIVAIVYGSPYPWQKNSIWSPTIRACYCCWYSEM